MKPALASLLVLGLAACAVDDLALETAPLELALDDGPTGAPVTGLVKKAGAVPDRYIVVMKSGSRRAQADLGSAISRLASAHAAEVMARYTTALEGFVARMSEAAAEALAADPDVAWVEQDAVVHTTATQSNATWGIDRVDQAALPLDTRFKYLTSGAGVTAYVLDTGLRATHQEFTGRILPGFTAINDGQGTNDCQFHGTHVSGTIVGKVLGIAKDAKVVPVRVLDCMGSGLVSGIIAGLDWVAANKQLPAVANMSLGGPASAAEDAAVRNLIAAGVPVVVAAGNDNADACTQSPAREPLAITVAASSSADARASFSNFGTCVDVFAPGVDITSASIAGDTLARTVSGTSQAAPHVAGAVALYLAANPTATPAAVAQALIAHAHTGKITDVKGSPNLLVNTMFVDTTRPVAAIMSPSNGAMVPASFQVAAAVTDANLESVQLAVDGQIVDTRAAGPFAFQVSGLALGGHTIAISATDGAGLVASTTVQVTVTSQAVPAPGQDPDDPRGTVTAGCSIGNGGNGGNGGSGAAMVLGLLAVLIGRRRRRV